MEPCLLYVISPPRIDDAAAFARDLEAVILAARGHVGAFQLRLKEPGSASGGRLTDSAPPRDVVADIARHLMPICRAHEVAFLLNDDAELAATLGADGVHLGQEDGGVLRARALLGDDAVIGVSCHASRHLAMEAGEAGADYVAFGAFYPTSSKSSQALEHWGTPEPEILRWWSTDTILPCVAIGGITPHNAVPLIEAGADFIAAISAIWHHPEGSTLAAAAFATILEKTSRKE